MGKSKPRRCNFWMQMYIFTRAILWLPNISRSKCSSVHDIVLTAMWHLILDWQGLLAAAQLKERKKTKRTPTKFRKQAMPLPDQDKVQQGLSEGHAWNKKWEGKKKAIKPKLYNKFKQANKFCPKGHFSHSQPTSDANIPCTNVCVVPFILLLHNLSLWAKPAAGRAKHIERQQEKLICQMTWRRTKKLVKKIDSLSL